MCHLKSLGSCNGGLRVSLVVQPAKNLPANAGIVRNLGSISGSGRSSREGHGHPLQHSCLKNPMDREAWQSAVHKVAQSLTWLKQLSIHSCCFSSSTHCVLDTDDTMEEKSEKADLKVNIKKLRSWHPVPSLLASRWINIGNSSRLYILGFQNHCRWWLLPWNKDTLAPWGALWKSYDQLRQCIKKQRCYFVDKVMSLLFNMLSRLVRTFFQGVSVL